MAITDGTAGAWGSGVTRAQSVTLPTHSAGQMLLVRVGWKSATPTTDVAVCNTSGWAKLGQYYDGQGVSSNGGGGVLVAAFWKEAASSSEPAPTIEFDDASAPNPGCWSAVTYNKGASENWLTPEWVANAVAAATAYTSTMGTHIACEAGDMLDAFVVTNDNTALTVPTVSQAGVTFDTVTEYPATALSSATGNDISADGRNRLATAGTSTAAAVVSGTNSVADTGAAAVIRLRVQAIVIEALAGTSDAAGTAEAAVTRTRGLAGTAAEASDATLASPARALSLAGTSDAVATGTGLISRAMALAGTSVAIADATGRAGLPRALAGTSAAVAATPTAPLGRARAVAGASAAVATGTGVVVRVRRIAGTAAEVSDSTSELTEVSGNIKALAGTSDAAATAEAALFRARNVALLGTAAETATASATATKYRALAASAAASGAATGAILRERTLAGTADALSAAEAVVDVDRLVALAALADAISSVDATLTMELGLAGTSAATSGIYGDTPLTVTPLGRMRWDGTQWNPGSIYRRRFTQA